VNGPEIRLHVPVLPSFLEYLTPASGETVLDATIGLGGHAAALLQATAPDGKLIGVDADEAHLALARENLKDFGDRVELHHANFREIPAMTFAPVDILFADLGLCSMHLDDTARGFSFASDAPLDMRFDRSRGKTAADIVADFSEEQLFHVFAEFGELPRSHALASRIVHVRKNLPMTHASHLCDVAEEIYRWKAKAMLPQIFQALRIVVNDEVGALDALLRAIPTLLRVGGRCGIMSYQSIDDRAVKRAFRALATSSKDTVTGAVRRESSFELVTKKAVRAGTEEVSRNPRARSVSFRVIRKHA
jgi:16S rRNA (cytosine1402-N4)-methyltransferase